MGNKWMAIIIYLRGVENRFPHYKLFPGEAVFRRLSSKNVGIVIAWWREGIKVSKKLYGIRLSFGGFVAAMVFPTASLSFFPLVFLSPRGQGTYYGTGRIVGKSTIRRIHHVEAIHMTVSWASFYHKTRPDPASVPQPSSVTSRRDQSP
jgi:hypothetical protein